MPKFSLNSIATTEFDYNYLISLLKDYKHPRGKINELLKSAEIIRVKKGLYVQKDKSFSLPLLGNLIYGPSYVSLDYALSFYNLIPEEVKVVTSITTGRKKHFYTPVGEFSYQHLEPAIYAVGLTQHFVDDKRSFLIATPEKALCDRIAKAKGLNTVSQLKDYLVDDLRIELSNLQKFSLTRLRKIGTIYNRANINLLTDLIQTLVKK